MKYEQWYSAFALVSQSFSSLIQQQQRPFRFLLPWCRMLHDMPIPFLSGFCGFFIIHVAFFHNSCSLKVRPSLNYILEKSCKDSPSPLEKLAQIQRSRSGLRLDCSSFPFDFPFSFSVEINSVNMNFKVKFSSPIMPYDVTC